MIQNNALISDISIENKLLDQLSVQFNEIYEDFIRLKEVEFVNYSINAKNSTIPAKYIETLYPFTMVLNSAYLTFLESYDDYKFVNGDYISHLFHSYFQSVDIPVTAFINQTILLDNVNLPLATQEYFQQKFLTKENLKITNCSVTYKKYDNVIKDELMGTNTIKDIYILTDSKIDVSKHDIISFNEYDKVITKEEKTNIFLNELNFNKITLNALYLTNSDTYINNEILYKEYIPKDSLYLASNLVLNKNILNMITVSNAKVYFMEHKANKDWFAPYVEKDYNPKIVDNLYKLITKGGDEQANKEEAVTYKELKDSVNNILDFILDKASGACDG